MPTIFNPSLIEATLSTVFDLFKQRLITTSTDRADFDFVLAKDEKKIAIEVKGENVRPSIIVRIKETLSKHPEVDEFILVTPSVPLSSQIMYFNDLLRDIAANAEWLSINQFLKKFYNLEINNNDDLFELQMAAITSKMSNYTKDVIGSHLPIDVSQNDLAKSFEDIKNGDITISGHLLALRRQFPDSILATLTPISEQLLTQLHIGDKYNNAIIVLTDIKNFSSIVSAADPEDLNEAMNKYYTNARDLVFKYNGILDKFIGDAVLAIFNYPKKTSISYVNTIKFCSELIQLGNETLENLLSKMDQAIETGTRVGSSNGPIYTLNIGQVDIEVTFIGEKINFAARLEKNCDIDGILLSNRFYNQLKQDFNDLCDSLTIQKKELSPTDAKGQVMTTTAWQIQKLDIQRIINYKVRDTNVDVNISSPSQNLDT